MENTSPFLFDNVDEKYFLAVQGKAIGPLTAQDVYERIQKGEAGPLHYLWRDGWNDWKRVCDEREFAVLVPQKPTTASIDHIKQKIGKKSAVAAKTPAAAADDDAKNIYLYFNRSQYGPFSKNELMHVLKSHKLDRSAYMWMPGWPNWKRIAEMKEYAAQLAPVVEVEEPSRTREPEVFKKKKSGQTRNTKKIEKTMGVELATQAGVDESERRGAPRRPLVARLFLHNDKDVIIAVCRDISIGGMQVLTDRVPGPEGTTIKLNVSPGDPGRVKGFVAEGEIVRVLEDGRGFSFRFTKISDDAKKTIKKYIETD